MTALFVNAYYVERYYGGPEEGGWWYDVGTLVRSEPATADNVDDLYDRMVREYPYTGRRYSVNGGDDWSVLIEQHAGQNFPTERPVYE